MALAFKHVTAAMVLATSNTRKERTKMADLKKQLCGQTLDDVLHCRAAFINEHLLQDIADVAPAKRHGTCTAWHAFACLSENRGVTHRHAQPSEQRRPLS